MDFFESQALAHRRTKWLLVYFALAVLGIIGTLHLLAAWALGESLTDWRLLGMISVGVLLVVSLGALYRIAELSRGGGGVVAEMLGGRQLAPNSLDRREIQLRNVVEEMALASGMPVPDIYVLDDEPAINAFAAGNTPGDAVVAVTRGTLDALDRDQLQGVVAHEFSHILNGDMRLNLRLMGGLNGILLLAIMGRILFEIGARLGGGSRDGDGKAKVPLFALGAALWLVGSIGVFFAKLIKAAVSRQREFLADASAVQFTRNPDGIAGALWKIGRTGSKLASPRSAEASHLFFGNGIGESLVGLFATHPPLDQRIRAIAPAFQPPEPAKPAATPPPLPEPVTRPTADHLLVAGAMLTALPAFARDATRSTASAVPLIYALLLSGDPATRERQLATLTLTPAERPELTRDLTRRDGITDALAIMDLCLPALRKLSPPQYQTFRANVRRLVACDGKVDLFEFVLHQALVRHVDHFFQPHAGPVVRYRSVPPLRPDVSVVLSAMSALAGGEDAPRDAAFAAGAAALPLEPGAPPLARAPSVQLPSVETALARMAEADPPTKQKLLHACTLTVQHDGLIQPREAALLRAVADVLGCPLPAMRPVESPSLDEALGLTPP